VCLRKCVCMCVRMHVCVCAYKEWLLRGLSVCMYEGREGGRGGGVYLESK